MTPRLAVTRRQVDELLSTLDGAVSATVTLRLPERPTMPMVDFTAWGGDVVDRTPINIPEGVEVLVVYPCPECDTFDARAVVDHRYGCQRCHGSTFVPVALATLAEVYSVHLHYVDGRLPTWEFAVTLSDIKPVEADQ